MKKAILINPPSGMYIRDDRCQVPAGNLSSTLRMPLDLAYMAAILEKADFTCLIKDYPPEGGNWDTLKKDLIGFHPDFLVVNTTTPTIFDDMTACKIAKDIDKNILTIAKGAHFLLEDMSIMQQYEDLDIAIRSGYEITIKELGEGKSHKDMLNITYREDGKPKRNASGPFLDNLDILPLPSRHLLNNSFYRRPDTNEPMTSIETNRGCPANCIFCLVKQTYGKKIVSRSPESIADEMSICCKKYGIYNFYFRADTFTWNKKWVVETCKKIIAKNSKFHWVANSRVDTLDEDRIYWMKKAGCWMIGLGAESGDQGILDKMKKGITLRQTKDAVELCRKFGIKSYLFWVLGMPWEDEKTINNTIMFAKKLKSDFAEFHVAFPFPGTEFYYIALENGLFVKDDLVKGDVKHGIVRTFFLPPEKLRHYQHLAVRKYYLDAGRIFRLLKGISSPKVFVNYCRKALAVLGK